MYCLFQESALRRALTSVFAFALIATACSASPNLDLTDAAIADQQSAATESVDDPVPPLAAPDEDEPASDDPDVSTETADGDDTGTQADSDVSIDEVLRLLDDAAASTEMAQEHAAAARDAAVTARDNADFAVEVAEIAAGEADALAAQAEASTDQAEADDALASEEQARSREDLASQFADDAVAGADAATEAADRAEDAAARASSAVDAIATDEPEPTQQFVDNVDDAVATAAVAAAEANEARTDAESNEAATRVLARQAEQAAFGVTDATTDDTTTSDSDGDEPDPDAGGADGDGDDNAEDDADPDDPDADADPDSTGDPDADTDPDADPDSTDDQDADTDPDSTDDPDADTGPDSTDDPDGDDPDADTGPDSTDDPDTSTDTDVDPDGDSEPAPTPTSAPTSAPEPPSCRTLDVDDFGEVRVELTLTSTLAQQGDVIVRYSLEGGGADPITLTETLEDLRPGEQVRFNVAGVLDATGQVTCTITAVESVTPSGVTAQPSDGDGCRFVEIDSFGDIQIEVSVANPFGGSRIFVDYALISDGVRFADGATFGANVVDGSQITIAEDTLTPAPEWVDPATITCEALTIHTL